MMGRALTLLRVAARRARAASYRSKQEPCSEKMTQFRVRVSASDPIPIGGAGE